MASLHKRYIGRCLLLVGVGLYFLLAVIHFAAIVIGAPAYEFLDTPELADLVRKGSMLPAWLTAGLVVFFMLCAFYLLSGAGVIRRLPMTKTMIWCIGLLFLLRGLAVFWFVYLFMAGSSALNYNEIVFSLFAFCLGFVTLYGFYRVSK